MKKNYFMLVCLVLFMAVNAAAQVSSAADLYGDYKFTADVEYTNDGLAYKEMLSGDCDAKIESDATYQGKISGFAGAQNALNIFKVNVADNTLEIINPNYNALWNNSLMLANADADNPYGVNIDGNYVAYNEIICTFDPSTKEISFPDFTVVTVANPGTDAKGTIMATYKNAKLTYVGGESEKPETPSFDWAGTYTFNGTPNTMDGSEFPSTFEVVVEYVEATEYLEAGYVVTNFMGNDVTNLNYDGGIRLTVESDGKKAALANGNVHSLGGGFFLKLFDVNATETPIAVTLNEDGSLAMANFSVVSGEYGKSEGNTLVGWYENVTLVKAGAGGGSDTAEFSWVGQHTVKAGIVESYDGKEYPSEFVMTVVERDGKLLVTEFMGNDVNSINNGGIPFAVAEDGMSAEMTAGTLVGGAYPEYLKMYDMNATASPIAFTLNSDGSVKIANFFVKNWNYETGKETAAVYYQDLVIPAAGGSEPEVPEFDWLGTWEVTAGSMHSYDGKEYAGKFYMTIIENGAELYITQFLSNDVNAINYGGIPFAVAADGMSAEMTAGKLAGGVYPSYLKLYDMNGTTSPVRFTANADGTITIADFLIKNFDYTTNEEEYAVFYQNLVATKCPTGIDNVTVEDSAVQGIFDMQGRKVGQIAAPGLYIVNGKKVLVK